MEEVDVPIVAGAKYEDIDGKTVRVKSVWVDEDLTTNVQIVGGVESRTLSLEEFAPRIGPINLERVNTDHEAWEWRQE